MAKHEAASVTGRLNALHGSEARPLDAGLRRAQRWAMARHEW
ncbi:MAG TPA: hypothetical protein VH137_01445 [Gemmatimonadales bacterium]|nr:hypothetical protein [Gemmatimonadales bacterium]